MSIELLSHDGRTANPDLLEIRCGLEFLSKEGSVPSVMGLVAETGNELEVIYAQLFVQVDETLAKLKAKGFFHFGERDIEDEFERCV